MTSTTSAERPMPLNRRVVITGYGALTCLGQDAKSTWEGMRSGTSGIARLTPEPFAVFKDTWTVRIGGEIKNLETDRFLEKREAKRLDRCTLLGIGAAVEAVAHSGIQFDAIDREHAGVVIGSGIGGISTIEEGVHTLASRGPDRISPFTVPRLMANATAGNVSIRFGLTGPCSCHATACASSGHAIADAANYIRRGHAEVMITGGTEAAITPLCLASFMTMKALSTRNDEPTRASRPFDVDRDGFILAEGAAMLVIESLEHALARGATIHAEIVGAGNSADAHHITAPDAGARAPRAPCAGPCRTPASTHRHRLHQRPRHLDALGDQAEVAAVLNIFGDHARKSAGGKLLMSSTKGVHGHALGRPARSSPSPASTPSATASSPRRPTSTTPTSPSTSTSSPTTPASGPSSTR
jgi:3-oxoacyl-[acyl-carrier-protein] synthase II